VKAGEFDRRDTVVTFDTFGEIKPGAYLMIDKQGAETPVQILANGKGIFILRRLPAGESVQFELKAGSPGATRDRVTFEKAKGAVTFQIGTRSVLTYVAEKRHPPLPEIPPIYARGGYIHPVYTPSGVLVTDDYPPDHYHHHGIWSAWTNTQFEGRQPDFWNVRMRTGSVEPVGLDKLFDGVVAGGFRARHRYIDLTTGQPKPVLNEEWEVSIYNSLNDPPSKWIFDLVQRQECASSSELRLLQYRYGGVGFRGHRQWLGPENTFFLTSEGKDRSNGHGTRARWCEIAGPVDGRLAAVAVLGHPENEEFPEPMRINPIQPFFNFSPTAAGPSAIVPDKPRVTRYRFVVYDGRSDPAEIDRLWNDYAYPPAVQVTSG